MKPTGKPYIIYQGRKYKDQEWSLKTTFGEGDYVPVVDAEEEEPMVEEKDEGREFGQILLKSMQELSRRIEEMGQKFTIDQRQHETPSGFHIEEGFGTSHQYRSSSQRSRLCHSLPHVLRCPYFRLRAWGREDLRS